MNKLKIIKDAQFKRKIRIILFSLCAVSLLSSYFVGSYFMSLRVFNSIPDTIDNLNTIYIKAKYLYSIISFYEENIIRNQSLTLFENSSQNAVNYAISIF